MSVEEPKSPVRDSRRKESAITALVGWMPLSLGFTLRRLLYRKIVAKLGNGVSIYPDIEFINASCVEIGDSVKILRGVRIDGRGKNTKICIGDRVQIDRGVSIKASRDNCQIEIGDRTSISPYSLIHGPGNIKIGKDCLIAAHVGIYASRHEFADPARPIREQGITAKGITIEDDCWLGHGVTVLDGVTIGKGSVIGAGGVVSKDIPPYSIAVGVPAKVISKRDGNVLRTNEILESVSVQS